jgi:hypothetical protein
MKCLFSCVVSILWLFIALSAHVCSWRFSWGSGLNTRNQMEITDETAADKLVFINLFRPLMYPSIFRYRFCTFCTIILYSFCILVAHSFIRASGSVVLLCWILCLWTLLYLSSCNFSNLHLFSKECGDIFCCHCGQNASGPHLCRQFAALCLKWSTIPNFPITAYCPRSRQDRCIQHTITIKTPFCYFPSKSVQVETLQDFVIPTRKKKSAWS